MRISTVTFVLFTISQCVLAGGEKSVPEGVYGDEEWQANPTYNRDTDSYWVVVNKPMFINEQCMQEVSYGGRSILGSAKIPCSTIPVVYADQEELIVGNVIYVIATGTVVLVTPEHTCVQRYYSFNNNRWTVQRKLLPAPECQNKRRDMKDALMDIVSQQLGGESNPVWNKFLAKLQEEYGDLDHSNNDGTGSNDIDISNIGNGASLGSNGFANQYPQFTPGQQLGQKPQEPAQVNNHNLGNIGSDNNFVTTGSTVVDNQYPQYILGQQQKPQVNQGPQNNPLAPKLGQMSQVNQGPQNFPGLQQLGQMPQVNQGPQNFPVEQQQNNQKLQDNALVQLLTKVADTLLNVVDWLAEKLGINSQSPLLTSLRNKFSAISGYSKKSLESSEVITS